MRIFAAALCLVAGCSSCKNPQKQAPPATHGSEAKLSPPPPRPSLELANVSGAGVVPTTDVGPKIVMSKDAISLDGDPVVAITNGEVDKSRLEALTTRLETKATSDAPLQVTLDASLTYFQVGILFGALKHAGFRNLALLTGNGSTMIPLELPDSDEVSGKGLRPVVTVKKDRVSVWSASGEEGTRARPKLSYETGNPPDFGPVRRALVDMVDRHWPMGRAREDADKTIILQLDGTKTVADLLQLAAAVRADGTIVLFPGIYLAGTR